MEVAGLIHHENALYGVSFPDLPGCVSAGNSFTEMLAMGAEALSIHLESMVEDNDPIPDFRSVAELEKDEDLQGFFAGCDFAVLYTVDIQGQTVRVRVKADHVPLSQRHDAAE